MIMDRRNVPPRKYFSKSYGGIREAVMRLSDFLSGRDPEGRRKRIVVAIARKGPHFESILSSALRDKGLSADFVSDIAVPFVDFATYDEVVILDDAVYYGTTFRKVSLLVKTAIERCGRTLDDCDLISWPLVVSDRESGVLHPESFIDGQPRMLEDDMTYVKEVNEAFYVNTVIDFIQAQHVPYDVEIPVFRLRAAASETPDDFVHRVCLSLSDAFGVNVTNYVTRRYNRMVGEEMSTYVVLLDELFAQSDGLKPDISKLKLIFNTDPDGYVSDVTVAAYCINTITGDFLDEGNDLFPEDVVVDIWDRITATSPRRSSGSDEILADYYEHYEKSLAAIANWLYSTFMAKKMLREAGIWDDSAFARGVAQGLRTLCGITDSVRLNQLTEVFAYTDFDVFGRRYAASAHEPFAYFPKAYRKDFENEWYDQTHRTDRSEPLDVGMCMSIEFGAMHRNIEIPSRRLSSDVFRRLMFGESIDSMCERYRFTLGAWPDVKSVRENVNRELDLRVDAGSIVPVYALQSGSYSTRHWVRLFRPGENDDMVREQFARNFIFIVCTLMRLTDVFTFNGSNFVNRLVILNTNINRQKSGARRLIFGYEMRHYWNKDKNDLGLLIKTAPGFEVDLMAFALDCGVLQQLDDNNYKLCDSGFVRSVRVGNLFDEDQESLIRNINDGIVFLERQLFGPLVPARQIASWFVWNSDVAISDARKIVTVLATERFTDISRQFAELHEMFYRLYSMVPSCAPDIAHMHQTDGGAEVMADFIRQRILRDLDTFLVFDRLINLFRLSYLMESRYLYDTDWSVICAFLDTIPNDFDPELHLSGRLYRLSDIWTDSNLRAEFDSAPEDTIRDLNNRVAHKAEMIISSLCDRLALQTVS